MKKMLGSLFLFFSFCLVIHAAPLNAATLKYYVEGLNNKLDDVTVKTNDAYSVNDALAKKVSDALDVADNLLKTGNLGQMEKDTLQWYIKWIPTYHKQAAELLKTTSDNNAGSKFDITEFGKSKLNNIFSITTARQKYATIVAGIEEDSAAAAKASSLNYGTQKTIDEFYEFVANNID